MNALQAGWRSHDPRSRWLLAIVIATTFVGLCASMLTPYSAAWRIVRFVVDALFLVTLFVIVATPAAMQRPPAPATRADRIARLFRGALWILAQVPFWVLAVLIVVGLFTAPGENAAVIIWRVTTAVSAAVVINSYLRNAFWKGGRLLRAFSIGIAAVEIVALIATVWIDIPAIVQSLDLASGSAIRKLDSSEGLALPPGVIAKFRGNPSFSRAFTTSGDRIYATPEAAGLFRFMGDHPFTVVLHNLTSVRVFNPEALACAIARNPTAPTEGYGSQGGVVSYVLPLYARCSVRLEKLSAFIAALPSEATPAEQDADIRACGSVRLGATYMAIASLRDEPNAQAAVIAMLPPDERPIENDDGAVLCPRTGT